MAAVSWVFSLADFPQKQQECFSEDHYWFIGRGRSKLFQVVVLILEASITFFLFKLQRQQCLESEPVGGEILFFFCFFFLGGGGGLTNSK